MKIEKMNDNQIRCTLTKEDLASRKIKLSELAYGTEKAKSLFRDMMQQANYEFGFEAEDIPLMIEAIPLNSDCIVLIITKVEDPEELDTRFSRFSPAVEDAALEELEQNRPETPLDLFHQSIESKNLPSQPVTAPEPSENLSRVFLFSSLERILDVSRLVQDDFAGNSVLYKGLGESEYLLRIDNAGCASGVFDKVCNLLSEYGSFCRSKKYEPAFLTEHCEALIPQNALSILGSRNMQS